MIPFAKLFSILKLVRAPRDQLAIFEEPIRYEIFSAERLESHAKRLEAQQTNPNEIVLQEHTLQAAANVTGCGETSTSAG